ncbi:T9SS C-terminal target domain-containing protein [candidate division KSB1 bacterium]|nr:cellulase family glycosylhydrolase [candidate division KSB1 bacterium]RQW01534.1 MAG: T9SS C-terminal target domain-containing protein [candidate division KSB1 bacterium]
MKKSALVVLFFSISLFAQSSIITFHAINTITWETITPDSIYILNVTQYTDTMLVGTTTFDLAGPATVYNESLLPPNRFYLSNNYPNSFVEATEFVITLPVNDDITVDVYNVLGQRVANFSSLLPQGDHAFLLEGAGLANGVYFVRAAGSQGIQTIKMLKAGEQVPSPVELNYRGSGSVPVAATLDKSGHGPGDTYSFTVYADGFIPQMLDNQVPNGGETFQFDLMPLPPPDDYTSHWFGFNLLGKFTVEWSNDGYVEKDFQMISDLGFNFVRLPIDYRTFTQPNDWTAYDPKGLAQIDDAVAWGQKYGIHVSINLHRAPGYCVNPPGQSLPPHQDVSLWENKEAQAAFTAQWRMFAERYKDIPRDALSFNLVNEPADVDGDTYVNAVLPAIEAIQQVSPDRIIISDGVEWGNARVDEILEYGVVMSPHFYNPFQLTHYKAEWVDGSDTWPEPSWPPQLVANYFYGSYKAPWDTPLEIECDFAAGTIITLHVQQVSTAADFRVATEDGTVYTHFFKPGPGEGEWKEVIYAEEWDVYQNIYDRDYSFTLDKAAKKLSMKIYDGDWMTFSSLRIEPPASSGLPTIETQPGITDWGVPQAAFRVDENGTLIVKKAPKGFEDRYKMNGFLDQWIDLKRNGTPVHVGEWGVYNKTPHDVTLRFMENRLKAMKAAGLGWALWNFRDSFGILDSNRPDVIYEDYNGHKLDRQMLELLLEYSE